MEKMRTLLFANIKYLIVSNEPKKIVAHAFSIKDMLDKLEYYQTFYPREKDYHCLALKSMIRKDYSAFQRYVTDKVISFCYRNALNYDSASVNQIINYICKYYKDKFDKR